MECEERGTVNFYNYCGCCNKGDAGGITYSTTEVLTGDTWIDGKPIYAQVFTGSITAAANTRSIQTIATISGIDKILECGGWMNIGSQGVLLVGSVVGAEVPSNSMARYAGVVLYNDQLSLVGMATENRTNAPYELCVKYTK
ncbi:MAG: hypothetical protein LBV33_08355 [Lachnospiraceae bacterium]|jgi:hypothetical protein|nr:hypothetical protein [Lachnospiraceae bacterium]